LHSAERGGRLAEGKDRPKTEKESSADFVKAIGAIERAPSHRKDETRKRSSQDLCSRLKKGSGRRSCSELLKKSGMRRKNRHKSNPTAEVAKNKKLKNGPGQEGDGRRIRREIKGLLEGGSSWLRASKTQQQRTRRKAPVPEMYGKGGASTNFEMSGENPRRNWRRGN